MSVASLGLKDSDAPWQALCFRQRSDESDFVTIHCVVGTNLAVHEAPCLACCCSSLEMVE